MEVLVGSLIDSKKETTITYCVSIGILKVTQFFFDINISPSDVILYYFLEI
jgi:hypothetical protein